MSDVKKYILVGILLLCVNSLYAQEGADSTVGGDLKLPPLDSLFSWAATNSPQLRMQDALIEKTKADSKRIKKQWMDAFKFSANIRTGTYGNAIIDQVETGYTYGPTLSFSLYEIASRHNLVDVYKAEGRVAQSKRELADMELRRIVMLLYNNIISQKNILRIRSEAVNSAYLHMKMAEKEFTEGSIPLGELSRVTEIYTKAQTDQEQTINDLKNNYMDLSQLCGRPLTF